VEYCTAIRDAVAALARKMGYPAGEALALQNLSLGMYYAGDLEDAVAWARQAERIDPGGHSRLDRPARRRPQDSLRRQRLTRAQRNAMKYEETCGRTRGAFPLMQPARLAAFSHQAASDGHSQGCVHPVAESAKEVAT
jgi:hypothetical protein